MPTRLLREGIISSPRVNSLSPLAELFYRRLMSIVDDYGRFYAAPMSLRAACYPLRLDSVRDSDVAKWLSECASSRLLVVYEVASVRYLEMLDFRQQVRAKKSKYPEKPQDAEQVPSERLAPAKRTNGADDPTPVVAQIPIIGGEWDIHQSFIEEMTRIYSGVDVPQTISEIRGWCIGNPTRLKTAAGVKRFVVAWLQREQNK